jgi:hypothetical protein
MTKLPNNYNPIYHDCEKKGCWNEKYRPNIEYFYHALPRKLTMSDIDAVAEVNGHLLFMEWKSFKGDLPVGQRIMFQRLTEASDKITVVVVHGDCETMSVENIMGIHGGKFSEWKPCDLEELFDRVKRWSTRVDIQAVGCVKS